MHVRFINYMRVLVVFRVPILFKHTWFRKCVCEIGDAPAFLKKWPHPCHLLGSVHISSHISILRQFNKTRDLHIVSIVWKENVKWWRLYGTYVLPGAWETETVFTHRKAQWSKTEEQDQNYLTTKFMRIQKIPSQIDSGKNVAHLFWLQILLQTLESIISHHRSPLNIIQCQIEGNFTSSALIHQCVKSSEYTFFCRKLFFAFFSSFIQSNKKS